MKTLKVKSCPFCGGKVKAVQVDKLCHDTTSLYIIPIWQFRCQNKECRAVVLFDCDRANYKPDEAFELYNKRHYPSEQFRWLHGED